MVGLRGFEDRLRQLEGRGSCPLCEEARAAVLESIIAPELGTASRLCEECGRDVRPTVFEIDRLLELEGGEGAY